MKYFKYILGAAAFIAVLFAAAPVVTPVHAATTVCATFGGCTGTSSPSGILFGDNGATNHLNTVTVGSGLLFSGGILTTSGTGGTAFAFTPTTNFGTGANATSTPLWFQAGLQASTTSYFTNIFPQKIDTTLYASQFPGVDMGVKIKASYDALPSDGGRVIVPAGTYNFASPMNFTTSGKPVIVEGAGSDATNLVYTGQSTSTVFRTGQNGDISSGMRDLTLSGTSTDDIAPGIEMGGGGGSFAYGRFVNVHTTKLGDAWYVGTNGYIINFDHITSDFNRRAFVIGNGSNQNELLTFTGGSLFADNRYTVANPYDHCFEATPSLSQGAPSLEFIGASFDKCQIYIGGEVNVDITDSHQEILSNGVAYTPMVVAGDSNTTVRIHGGHLLDGNDAAHSPSCMMTISGNAHVSIDGLAVSSYGGYVVPTFACNTGTGRRSYLNMDNVANTGWTTLETTNETGGNFDNNYLSGQNLGLGTTSQLGLLNLQGSFAAIAIGNGGTNGGYVNMGVTNDGNAAGGNRFVICKPGSSLLCALTLTLGQTPNFGVGSTSPGSKLAVQGNLGDTNRNLFTISSTSPDGSVSDVFQVNNLGSTTLGLFGACSGSSALTTTSGGMIACGAISVANAASSTLLADVNTWTNTQKFSGGLTAYASSTIGDGTSGGGLLISGNGTTTGAFYAKTALVVGSTTQNIPTVALTVNPQRSSSGLVPVVYINYTGSGGTVGDGPTINWTDNSVRDGVLAQSGYKRIFITNNNERVRIETAGNFDIGTTTSNAKLGVHLLAVDTNLNAFIIGSSTSNSTTTLFSVSNIGSTTIGLFGSCSGANAIQSSAAGTLTCGAVVSDPRLKKDIQSLDSVADKMRQVIPISYYWKEAYRGEAQEYGFNAKELQKIFPQAVETMAPTDLTPDGTLEIKLPALVAALWQGYLEQQHQLDNLSVTAAKSAQDNWQDVLLALLIAYVAYNEYDKRKRK